MAYFESAVITNDGKNMLMRDMIGIGNIEFVKMVAGAGEYSGEERKRNVIEQRTSLKDQRQEFPFNAIEIASEKSVLLKSVITNKDLEEGYRITEVGIYAREKGSDGEGILYSMDLAIEADFLPPYNGLNPTEITQEYYVTVSNASIVSIVSDEKTFALYDDLIALENKVTIMEENVGVFENSISDAFSKEKDYVRGDYTIYENTLYKFIDTKAAGEWDRNVVQAVTMSNELLVLQEKTEENKRLYEQVEFEDYSSNEQEIPETEEAIDQIVSGKSTKVLYQYIKAALKGLLALAKRALNIALGKNQARVFATVTALDTWLEVPENIAKLNIGDNFYITATDVPDYWWDGKQKQKLETQKVDLIPYDREIAALKQKDSELSGNISSHNHDGRYFTESEINAKLAEKSDTLHSHVWSAITGKPNTFLPSTHSHDDRYFTESEMNNKLAGKSDTSHNHNNQYYVKSEVDTKLNGKSNTNHNHAWSGITGKPTTFIPSSHNHNDLYFTEEEINKMLHLSGGNISFVNDADAFKVFMQTSDAKFVLYFELNKQENVIKINRVMNGVWGTPKKIYP